MQNKLVFNGFWMINNTLLWFSYTSCNKKGVTLHLTDYCFYVVSLWLLQRNACIVFNEVWVSEEGASCYLCYFCTSVNEWKNFVE